MLHFTSQKIEILNDHFGCDGRQCLNLTENEGNIFGQAMRAGMESLSNMLRRKLPLIFDDSYGYVSLMIMLNRLFQLLIAPCLLETKRASGRYSSDR